MKYFCIINYCPALWFDLIHIFTASLLSLPPYFMFQHANLNLDCLKKLESSNWSDRYEALDDVYDIIGTRTNEASANIMKV